MQAIGFQQGDVEVMAETYADDSSRMIGMSPPVTVVLVRRVMGVRHYPLMSPRGMNLGNLLSVTTKNISCPTSD
jgi:hypothetical protein